MNHKAFEMKQRNDLLLYKMIIPPDIKPPTVAVIGCIDDAVGAIHTMGEMQARYFARMLKVSGREDRSFPVLDSGVFRGHCVMPPSPLEVNV